MKPLKMFTWKNLAYLVIVAELVFVSTFVLVPGYSTISDPEAAPSWKFYVLFLGTLVVVGFPTLILYPGFIPLLVKLASTTAVLLLLGGPLLIKLVQIEPFWENVLWLSTIAIAVCVFMVLSIVDMQIRNREISHNDV